MSELPHWFLAIGTGQIIAFVSTIVSMGVGVIYLIHIHTNPEKFGIGTKKSEMQNKEIIAIQKQMQKRLSQQLHVSLWQSFELAQGNGGAERFPTELRLLLESEVLLKEEDE